MVGLFLLLVVLILAIILLIFSSKIAVINSAALAAKIGISSLIIGITLVSIGTDIAEIFNSIISCGLGHGDIDVGDSVGSDLTQLTLIFGLLPILGGNFPVKKRCFVIIGSCEILSLILIFTVVSKGYFTRFDAFFMMLSLVFYSLITYNLLEDNINSQIQFINEKNSEKRPRLKSHFLLFAILGFGGVTLSSYLIIQSIIYLSYISGINEYIISFFMVSIGTSLPELSVDLAAIKQKHYRIAVGDIIGSCIVDSTLSIGIGQFLFPQSISAFAAIPTILYTLIASMIVIIFVSKREIVDRKAGILFIVIYALSFPAIFVITQFL